MENKDLAVEVKGLTKKFGQLTAVDNISFEVKNGEFFGFLGPNGAGKTTTARMLTGVIKKSEGEATVKGYPAGSFAAKQLSGVMPEISNAYLDLTAWGNIMLIAELYRIPPDKAKARAAALLEQLGLFERKDSKASTFSMGMRKRLVLCMALIPDPEILFLDEPTIGLDAISKLAVRDFIQRANREKEITVILTTHDMDDIEALCNRIMVIGNGKILSDGTLESLRAMVTRERRLVVHLERDDMEISDPDARVVMRDGTQVQFSFDPEVVPAHVLISRLAAKYPVRDLFVENPPIEEIIAKLYRQYESQ